MNTKAKSKFEQAVDILREVSQNNQASKPEVLEALMTRLGVTKANAYVYFTKATRALESENLPDTPGEIVSAIQASA